jgi:hypothetical protein
MKRLFATIGTALAGTTAGYVLHQTMAIKQAQSTDEQPQALIIGAPLATAGLAAVAGILFGKRSRIVAFVAGFLAAATLGDKIDDMIPGWPSSKQQVLDRFGKAGPPAEAAGVAPVAAVRTSSADVAVDAIGKAAGQAAEAVDAVADEAADGADGATSEEG